MSTETTEETLARHERQIAALKAAFKELLTDIGAASHPQVQVPNRWTALHELCKETYVLLDSDE